MTGGLAGLAIEGESCSGDSPTSTPMRCRRPEAFARVIGSPRPRRGRRASGSYFPQELGHYVAEVVLDMLAGAGGTSEGDLLPEADVAAAAAS